MFCVSVTFVLLAMYLEGRFVQWENKEAWRLSTQVLSNKGTDCHRQLVHDRTTEQNTTNFNNKITSKLCWFSITLLISFSSENFNIIVNREIQKVFFFQTKKVNSSNESCGYQPFLFFLRFFFGFGRHIGFFGAGVKLAAVILSLRACLQENQ